MSKENDNIHYIDKMTLDNLLISKFELSSYDADRLSDALLDIRSSFLNIYDKLLPKIIEHNDPNTNHDGMMSICDEFQHIQYHIVDADLLNLFYIKKQI